MHDSTQESGTEWRFVVKSGYDIYYYALDVPQDKDPREHFYEIYGEYPDICMRKKGTVKNG